MGNPTAAMLVIGDEILSGRTRDANMYHLAGRLSAMGIDLCEVRIVSDAQDAIISAMQALTQTYDHVFSSGGIGPTHDDITADCAAAAFGVGIDVREDARQALALNYPEGEAALTPGRLRMARIPEGAALIDNPISRAPGFAIGNLHVMAGVPAIFEAMVENVLADLAGGAPLLSESVRIDKGESSVSEELRVIAQNYPEVAIGSYPFKREGQFGTNIVLRSADQTALDAATNAVRALTV